MDGADGADTGLCFTRAFYRQVQRDATLLLLHSLLIDWEEGQKLRFTTGVDRLEDGACWRSRMDNVRQPFLHQGRR
jgi:hypothetical protein